MKVETLGDDFDAGDDAFLDAAAVIENLDLVISSDTSIAHLAGALGRPSGWRSNSVPDWRWLLERPDSPWYPTMRLFRQQARDDWRGVFSEIERALRELRIPERQQTKDREHRNVPEALNNRGMALHELRRLDEALAFYDKALAIRPDYADALNNRGAALHELKRLDEALESYDKALAVNSQHLDALGNRGKALAELKRFDEALAYYDKSLAIKPDSVAILYNRGMALRKLKRLDEALASYDKALAINPGYVDALNNRGIALQELKRIDEALASYEKALSIKPDYVDALTNRGVALHELRRLDEALAATRRRWRSSRTTSTPSIIAGLRLWT